MDLVMCRSCGEFIQAVQEDGGLVPIGDECPHCRGVEFKENGSGEILRIDE